VAGAGPERLLRLICGHWCIENRLHYVRDVSFGEDASQVRCGTAPQVLAALRNAAIGMVRDAG
jgi:predicted transposase YbfD/YdcC